VNERIRRNVFADTTKVSAASCVWSSPNIPTKIVRIREPVDLRFEMTSIIFELDRAGRNPVVVFENAGGQSMPIVTNVAGNRKLLAACLGVPVDDLASASGSVLRRCPSCRLRQGTAKCL
jgi:3-polyprenyl-4-hydroxybenzoate decarboxylase